MNNLSNFGTYAAAFEEVLQDDDWESLEQYFSDDAIYLPGDGTEARGRASVIRALQSSVNALEKKCDSRDLLGEPEISESGDTITLKYAIKYSKNAVPDFILSGYETVQFANAKILRMEDVFDDPSALADWKKKL